jgi:glutamate/tyrosine decarboxylase-like PLP-dependent enzyme
MPGAQDRGPDGADPLEELLVGAAQQAAAFRASLPGRGVAAQHDVAALRAAFGGELPAMGAAAAEVLAELIAAAQSGLVASAGPRFFGFVIGGALPAAVAADVLASGWDQCAFNPVLSPAACAAEEAAGSWLKQLLGLPAGASVGFVTGGQAANTIGLAGARHHVLAEAGWDVEVNGLAGAPPIRVVAGAERHATIDRSLRLLGLGTSVVEVVAADANGALELRDLDRVLATGPAGPLIVCLQAGNVNTGAVDPLGEACALARRHGAWIHVDGAFGLWAGASPRTRHLVEGVELADSWACDGHKWLNVPYDSGFAFCARPDVHAAAASYTAAYLTGSGQAAAGADYTLESSRRARGFATWAALRELGRDGVAELIDRTCALARMFAEQLGAGGAEIVNEVVLNQVLVSFGDDTTTDRVIEGVQRDGTCWVGGTTWRGRRLMRVAVSNWMTGERDVQMSVDAMLRVAGQAKQPSD